MADDDRVASTLAAIGKYHHHGHTSNPRRDYCIWDNQDWPCDVACLLAALEAVLKLADESDHQDVWTLNPASVREAISAALSGTGEDGES